MPEHSLYCKSKIILDVIIWRFKLGRGSDIYVLCVGLLFVNVAKALKLVEKTDRLPPSPPGGPYSVSVKFISV